jgi:hypothetical protein
MLSPFFQPPLATAMPTHEVIQNRPANNISIFKWKDMTADLLKQALPALMATWSEEKKENIKTHCQKSAYVVALMEYLYCQLPSTYCEATKLGGGERQIKWYKKAFPCGIITFTVPLAGREKDKLPDPMHESIEGTQIQLTRWDLNAPDYAIPCLECMDSLLKKAKFHPGQIHSAITPVFRKRSSLLCWQKRRCGIRGFSFDDHSRHLRSSC